MLRPSTPCQLREAAKTLQLFWHHFQFAFLQQAVRQRRAEGFKRCFAFGLQQFFGQLFLLSFKVGGIGFHLLGNAVDQPVLPQAQRSTSVALLEVEGRAKELPAADAGNRAIPGDGIARFWFQAERLSGSVKLFARFDALPQVVGLAFRLLDGLFFLEVGNDPVPDLFQSALVGVELFLDRQNYITAIHADRQAQVAGTQTKDLLLDALSVTQLEDRFGRSEERRVGKGGRWRWW